MKYYWIWSVVWTLSAFAGCMISEVTLTITLYTMSVVFVNSFGMWVICYMYYLREKR